MDKNLQQSIGAALFGAVHHRKSHQNHPTIMKKILSSIVIALCASAFVLVGCSKKQENTLEIPTFKSNNVNLYLKDYAAYCDSVKEPQQYAQIPEKMAEFAKRQAEVVKELQGETEVTAFNKCITQIRERFEKTRGEAAKAANK
ncbi:hypothetical protein CKA38_07250 [Ereboglobus luteus]|uniref:Uncharacterized protein n=2 Tax=Ereboglobus luteus TaxID=1796921 RepID=A0A2U8E2K3_9BACT|nr:hypothetical protein CKA38_07250 [Ereboglobus luteus]